MEGAKAELLKYMSEIDSSCKSLLTRALVYRMRNAVDNVDFSAPELREELSKTKEKLAKSDNDLKDFVSNFDSDEKEKKDLIAKNKELEKSLETLKSQLEVYRSSFKNSQKGSMTLNLSCNEKEKFPNEIHEYLSALLYKTANQTLANLDKQSCLRRYQVLKDFVESNRDISFEHTEACRREMKIDAAFKLDSTEKRLNALEKVDFYEVKNKKGGGHPKIRYYSDPDFQFSPSSTPSEKRGSKNLSHEITNKCLLLVNENQNQ